MKYGPRGLGNKCCELSAISGLTLHKKFKGHIRKQPNPPDAICYFENGEIIWIEVVTSYTNEFLAKSLNYMPIEDKVYFSKYKLEESIHNHKNKIIKNIISLIKKKDAKENYKAITNKYGKGILIVVINDPFTTEEFVNDIAVLLANFNFFNKKLNNFNSVYLNNQFSNGIKVYNGIPCLPRTIWKII